MSDKDRRKKEGKDKSKENQAMRVAEENPKVKRAFAAQNRTEQRADNMQKPEQNKK